MLVHVMAALLRETEGVVHMQQAARRTGQPVRAAAACSPDSVGKALAKAAARAAPLEEGREQPDSPHVEQRGAAQPLPLVSCVAHGSMRRPSLDTCGLVRWTASTLAVLPQRRRKTGCSPQSWWNRAPTLRRCTHRTMPAAVPFHLRTAPPVSFCRPGVIATFTTVFSRSMTRT